MRVLYFSRDYTTHDRRFLAAIAERHETHFLRLESDGIRYELRDLPRGVTSVAWPQSVRPDSPASIATALSRVLADLRPDVVHAGPVQTCARYVAMTGFPRLVTMSWGSDMLVDARATPALEAATREALSASKLVVCDCDAVRRACDAFVARPREAYVEFPWGIDLSAFPDEPRAQRSRDTFWLLSTRTWAPIYGIDVLLSAFASAHAQEPRLRLRLLGDGPLAAQIKAQIAELDLESVVLRPGRIAETALRGYYLSSDMYVSCAHSDGTSVSLLEAMACRLPAIVPAVGGNPEWIVPGRGGWVVPAGDPTALAPAMVEASLSHELEAMGGLNRQLVQARADWQRNAAALHAAYERARHVEFV